MSLEDFWINVQSGCVRLHRGFPIDRPFSGRDVIVDNLRKEAFWFRKQSVSGFNKADFDFLGMEARARLSDRVEEFERLLSNVTPQSPSSSLDANTTASREVKEQALNVFADIIETLEFGRFGNAEGFRLGKLIERELDPCPPQGVADLRFVARIDHSGDPALWITIYIDPDNSRTDETFLAKAREVEEIIDPVARRVCGERWPFYRMLSLDEAGSSEMVHVTPPKSAAHA